MSTRGSKSVTMSRVAPAGLEGGRSVLTLFRQFLKLRAQPAPHPGGRGLGETDAGEGGMDIIVFRLGTYPNVEIVEVSC